MKIKNRTLYFGDNLDILRDKIPDECIDLVYLDPPFNSKKDYNIIFSGKDGKSDAQVTAFEDTWDWTKPETQMAFEELIGVKSSKTEISGKVTDMIIGFEKILGKSGLMAYLTMMTIRLIELRRVLRSTGSIFLHCDPTASHYIKIAMDVIFGEKLFQNEIVWCYRTGGASKQRFSQKHDIILFYSKTNKYKFNSIKERIYYEKPFFDTKQDENGKYYADVLPVDFWEIPAVINMSKERLGYPTQKPEALLERIIKAASNEGDIVLDPFCGCGTTVAVAERFNRQWIGIDITTLATGIIKKRMEDHHPNIKITIEGLPKDLAGARELAKDKYEFQYWAVGIVGGRPMNDKKKKGIDYGIDGIITFNDIDERSQNITKKVIISVKGGENLTPSFIRDLRGVIEREKAVAGLLITLEEPTKGMVRETNEAGVFKRRLTGDEYPKLQIITAEKLIHGQKPNLPSGAEVIDPYKKAQKVKLLIKHEQKTIVE